jgi:hypothetical protein
MKKLFAILMISVTIMSVAPVKAQKIVMANYTDTITNSQTKYYPCTAQADLFFGSAGIYIDHLTGTTDSTLTVIQGSLDGSTWIDLGSSTYANQAKIGDAAPTTFKTFKSYTTDGGLIWMLTDRMTLPFYRYAVTHYATGTVRVKAWLYKKK